MYLMHSHVSLATKTRVFQSLRGGIEVLSRRKPGFIQNSLTSSSREKLATWARLIWTVFRLDFIPVVLLSKI